MAMNGYAGKIARVNLTTGQITILSTSDYVPLYHGGRGLGARLYWNENVPKDAPAFDPSNAFVVASGPASGTIGFGGRNAVGAKSPESMPEAYNVSAPGGNFSAQLKFAGFDAVVVVGKAPEPSYILIRDGEVSIRSADSFWEWGNHRTDREMRRLYGDRASSVMAGVSGINLTRTGAVNCDLGHAGGQGGYASVMGSKNLKTVTAIGHGGVKVANPQALIDFYDEYCRIGSKYGGPFVINSPAYEGFEGFSSEIGARVDTMADWFNWEDAEWSNYYMNREGLKAGTIRMKFVGCWGCSAFCQQVTMHEGADPNAEFPYNLDPPFAYGNQCHEYEYQNTLTQKAWGGMSHGKPGDFDCFMQQDMGVTSHLLGTDWRFLREATDADLITPAETGLPTTKGYYPDWNTKEFCGLKGWTYMASVKGNQFWSDAAEGMPRFMSGRAGRSEAWKTLYEKYVPRPFYNTDNRGGAGTSSPFSLLYDGTGLRGQPNAPSMTSTGKTASHYLTSAQVREQAAAQRAKYVALGIIGPKGVDLSGESVTWEDKVSYVIFMQRALMEANSSPGCQWVGYPRYSAPFAPGFVADPETVPILKAILGVDRTLKQWMEAMDPISNIERAIHSREGRRREHDTWSDYQFDRAKGWNGGTIEASKANFQENLTLYYQARGWNPDTAVPTRATLESLGMTDVANGLAAAGVPIT